jgi:hypothetical protein
MVPCAVFNVTGQFTMFLGHRRFSFTFLISQTQWLSFSYDSGKDFLESLSSVEEQSCPTGWAAMRGPEK